MHIRITGEEAEQPPDHLEWKGDVKDGQRVATQFDGPDELRFFNVFANAVVATSPLWERIDAFWNL